MKVSKRLENAYKNYVKRYKAKEKMMKKKSLEMADKKLTKREYIMVRQAMISEGREININQTIVSQQQYQYSQDVARRFKATAAKFNLDWKDTKITDIRLGAIDVSSINEQLKKEFPEMTGKERAAYISYSVFGSD